MKSTKRISTVIAAAFACLLLIVANGSAFGLGNVDGVWGLVEDGGGASCDDWASAGIPAFSTTDPSIQSSGGNLTDENRVSYGVPSGSYSCPSTWTGSQTQSGFGFNGINGPVSGLDMDTAFYLGSFTHYNNPINVPDNTFQWVDLDLTVPIDCDDDGTSDTSFAFSPRFFLDETSNNANPCPYKPGDPVNNNGCADAVTVAPPATSTFTCSSVPFTVNIYGFTSNADCSTVFDPNAVSTQYITREQATNNACLWAEVDRPNADASVTKSCFDFGSANPYYTITVTNAGPGTALGLKVVDTLPASVSFGSYTSTRTVGSVSTSQGTCTNNAGTVTCNLNAALPESTNDPTAKWEVLIYVDYTGLVGPTNSVALTTTSTDPNLANNTATANCSSAVDVGVNKADGDYGIFPYPTIGVSFEYTVTVTNSGPDTAQNVHMVDTLDFNTSFDTSYPIKVDDVEVDSSICSQTGSTVSCNLGDMAMDETKVITFWAVIGPNTPTLGMLEIGDTCTTPETTADICNTVTVQTDSNDTNSANNIAYEPKDVGVPNAVVLLSFTATPATDSVILNWETAEETNNLGFNLYRAISLDGERNKINPTIIPSLYPGNSIGAKYEYVDTDIESGVNYYYWLENINRFGGLQLKGPVNIINYVAKFYLPFVRGN